MKPNNLKQYLETVHSEYRQPKMIVCFNSITDYSYLILEIPSQNINLSTIKINYDVHDDEIIQETRVGCSQFAVITICEIEFQENHISLLI